MKDGRVAERQGGRAWRSTMAAVFMSAVIASAAVAQTDSAFRRAAAYSAAHDGDAVLVYRGSRLVLADYQNGFTAGRLHGLASGTKTFSCALAALGEARGLLRIDEPAARTITEWRSDPVKSKITIAELLHLTSGLEPDPTDHADYGRAIALPMVGAPGGQFAYGATSFFIFGEIMRRKLNGRDPASVLEQDVLGPLGDDSVFWVRDAHGNPHLAGGAVLTASEWGRFGVLLLQHGVWRGHRLLPAGPLAECARGSDANPSYGLGMWLNADDSAPPPPAGVERAGPKDRVLSAADLPHSIALAAGAGGQRLYLIPSHKLVIVRLGHNTGPDYRDDVFLRLALGRTR